jgi:hypothetical protein
LRKLNYKSSRLPEENRNQEDKLTIKDTECPVQSMLKTLIMHEVQTRDSMPVHLVGEKNTGNTMIR